jgi:hypothetical protein
MPRIVTAAAAVGAVLLSMPTVDAYAKYAAVLPNGMDVPGSANIGHLDPAGASGINDFGKGWNKFGKAWTKAYCEADSDGDGFTNGQELGDPCCTWTPAAPGNLITDGISNPGDKTKTPTNAQLQAKCGAAGGAAAGGGAAGGGGAGAGNATAPAAGGAGGAVKPGTVRPPADTNEDLESVTLKPMNSAQRSTVTTTAAAAVVSLVVALLW